MLMKQDYRTGIPHNLLPGHRQDWPSSTRDHLLLDHVPSCMVDGRTVLRAKLSCAHDFGMSSSNGAVLSDYRNGADSRSSSLRVCTRLVSRWKETRTILWRPSCHLHSSDVGRFPRSDTTLLTNHKLKLVR